MDVPPTTPEELFGADFRSAPHAWWRRLRRRSPVWRYPPAEAWLILGWEAAVEALRDDALGTDVYRRFRPSPLPLDSSFELPPRVHRSVRKALREALLDHETAGGRPVQSALDEVGPLPPGGRCDLVAEFARPLARALARRWLGMEEEQLRRLREVTRIAEDDDDPVRRHVAGTMFVERLVEAIESRREAPGKDLLSRLAVTWREHRLDDEHLVAFLGPMLASLVKGLGARLLVHTALALREEPRLQVRIREDGPDAARRAVLEAARWEPVNQLVPRRSRRPTEIAGFRLPEGRTVLVVVAAVCRDPSRHPRPEAFDIDREESSLAFGRGSHACLGRHLATGAAAGGVRRLVAGGERGAGGFRAAGDPEFRVDFNRACVGLPVAASDRDARAAAAPGPE